ncbi:MAG: GNAT family N-acetyltransferase [Rhodobacteraceae bacterium]|nr:GNAT family N-acetyltransferase [Paracoccaceae bacterium]
MITILRISTEETLPLRSHILREGRPFEECRFAQDELPGAFHLGAIHAERLAGIATFSPVALENLPGRGYQLRGMAVDGAVQRGGIGRLLLLAGEERLSVVGDVHYVWCNARIAACNFYLRNGFKFVSEVFDIPTVGPHRRMIKWLRPMPEGFSANSSSAH